MLLALFITACTATNPMTSALSPAPGTFPAFDVEGHRGARGLMPENTIPAMLKALELGVTTLEMDTHITRDGQVVLSHDPYFNPEHDLLPSGDEIPAADKHRYVLYQMDYDSIRQFDTGSKFYAKFPEQQKIKVHRPLLSDVIDTVQAYIAAHHLPQVFYNIETKSTAKTDSILHPAPEEFVQRLMLVVAQKGITPWVIIQSFDVRTLQVLHQLYPEVKTALLVENSAGWQANLRKLGFTPTIYSPYYKLVTNKLVADCHQQGMKVIPWTVNKLPEIEQLHAIGVDGIITDYPNLFR